MDALLNAIHNVSITVIGDIMLDHYIWGDTNRISPEAPVPVVEVRKDTYRAGGAANVALNIRALQGQTELCGWAGQDAAGQTLCSIFKEQGIAFDAAFLKADLPTILKTRVMVRSQQLCRLDREALPAQYTMQATETLALLKSKIAGKKAVIFSDYAKGVFSQSMAENLLAYAQSQGILVAQDPKPRHNFRLQGVDLLTPNKAESLLLADIILVPGEVYPAELVCQRIWEKFRPKNLVITLGADGMLISREGHVITQIPTYAHEVADVSGAGDTVIASLTLALAAGADLTEAAHLANTAAGIVVGKVGTATATPAEILSYPQKNVG